MTDRRTFVSTVALALLAAPRLSHAQQPVIGFVRSSSIEAVPHIVAAFRQGLRETGYVEGQSVAIEFRSAEDDDARLQAIIAELFDARWPCWSRTAQPHGAPRWPPRRSRSS